MEPSSSGCVLYDVESFKPPGRDSLYVVPTSCMGQREIPVSPAPNTHRVRTQSTRPKFKIPSSLTHPWKLFEKDSGRLTPHRPLSTKI